MSEPIPESMSQRSATARRNVAAVFAATTGAPAEAVLDELSDEEIHLLDGIVERLREATPDVEAHILGGLIW